MRFVFDERRAAQAATRLLDRHGGTMPWLKLVKLLYLADRAALVEGGWPITGDRFVSVRHGPALARVLELIKDDCPAKDSIWHGYVVRKRFDACLVGDTDNEWLSEYNMGILDGVFETYGCLKEWDVVARTHALPEWKDPGDTIIPIEPEDVLRYAGYSDEEVESVADQAEASYSLHTTLERIGRERRKKLEHAHGAAAR